MNELQRIQDQIRRSLDGEAWHGPPLMEVLARVSAPTASARPIADAHTPWEIVRHLSATARLVLSRLRGEARTLSADEDWPAPPTRGGAEAWQADLRELAGIHQQILQALSALEESSLDAPIVPGFSSVYVTLHGLVQHNLYHAGQIVMLDRATRALACT